MVEMMNYTVVLSLDGKKKKVQVPSVACASEAENIAKKQHPHDYVFDVFRGGGNSATAATRKSLPE